MLKHNLLLALGLGTAAALWAAAAEHAGRSDSAGEVHGSIQSIRGIEGIDSVPLQNLETVIRVQSRTPEQPRGTVRTAAALTTMESPKPEDPPEQPDGRAEHTESELKGS